MLETLSVADLYFFLSYLNGQLVELYFFFLKRGLSFVGKCVCVC